METAQRNATRRGFTHSFSAYVAWLIERDAAGDVVREDVEPYGKKVKPKKRAA